LLPEDSNTRLTYKATASVGGKLAQVGSRLIDGVARKMADDFFARFNATVAPADAAAAVAEPAPTQVRDLRWAWVAGGIVLLLLILFLIRRA
jgi:hypothetical protein